MKKNKVMEMVKDKNGSMSSKRIAGMVLLVGGIFMGAGLFMMSLMNPVGDPSTASEVMKFFLFTGGGLLGIGVLERKK